MTPFQLLPQQKAILHSLLNRHENALAGRTVSLTVRPERFPDYFRDESPDTVRQFEESLLSLQSKDWIALDFGKGAESHRFARIRLHRENAETIGAALHRLSLSDFRKQAEEIINFELNIIDDSGSPLPSWWQSHLTNKKETLKTLSPAHDQREEALRELRILFAAIRELLKLNARGERVPLRRFSVRVFADSKILLPFKSKIARILARESFGIETEELRQIDENAILSHFGITSKEEVHCLRGPLRFHFDCNPSITASDWQPFLPLPETMVHKLTRAENIGIKALLTIENEESFHSWCKENPKNDWLCFYTGGFPSRAALQFLKQLLKWMAPEGGIPFYHWGDLDVGGLEIFLFLERELGISIEPFAMGPSLLTEHKESTQPLSRSELHRLGRIRNSIGESHRLHSLASALLGCGRKLEQEGVLPWRASHRSYSLSNTTQTVGAGVIR